MAFHKTTALACVAALALLPGLCSADEGKDQAEFFTKIYISQCLKHLQNLDALRTALKDLPKLAPQKAELFVHGPGNAWPMPFKSGHFVLALPDRKPICLVYARRADTESALRLFTALVAKAPPPLTSKLLKDEHIQTEANGVTHTVSYEWSIPNAARKMLFTLTIAPSESAQLQALASAAIIGE